MRSRLTSICGPCPGGNPLEQLGHLRELARADDQVDVRRALEDQLLVLLGHAAQHADDLVRVLLLDVLQPAQGAVDLVLGMLADAAGVEEDRVGAAGAVDQLVARLAQTGHHQLAVEHVHLAADGFDVQTFGHGKPQWNELAPQTRSVPLGAPSVRAKRGRFSRFSDQGLPAGTTWRNNMEDVLRADPRTLGGAAIFRSHRAPAAVLG